MENKYTCSKKLKKIKKNQNSPRNPAGFKAAST